MTSLITTGNLSVVTTETLALTHSGVSGDSRTMTQQNTFPGTGTIAGNRAIQQIFELTSTAQQIILNLDTTESAGTVVRGDVKYIRVTNLDDTATLTVGVEGGNQVAYFRLPVSGASFTLYDTVIETDDDSGAAVSSFTNIDSIEVKGAAGQEVELYVVLT